jgi:hypothetical protein
MRSVVTLVPTMRFAATAPAEAGWAATGERSWEILNLDVGARHAAAPRLFSWKMAGPYPTL